MKPKTKFEQLCERVSETTSVDVYFSRQEPGPNQFYEDDGALCVRQRGVRAIFSIGQDLPLREQNERITKVATALGMEARLKDKYILFSQREIDEEESEENT